MTPSDAARSESGRASNEGISHERRPRATGNATKLDSVERFWYRRILGLRSFRIPPARALACGSSARWAADHSRKATWSPFGFARACRLPLVADVRRVDGEFEKSARASGGYFRTATRQGVISGVREADPMGQTATPGLEDPPAVSGVGVRFLFSFFIRPSTHVAVPTMVAVFRGGLSGVS